MKEAFEKIVERLEEQKSDWNCDYNVPINDAIRIVNQVAEEYAEKEFSEWCHDCPAYDKENHHCPRWCKVIRTTVEEIKEGYNREWIPCSEEMPPLSERVLLTVYVEGGNFNVEIAEYFGDYDWLFDDEHYSYTSAKWEVIAWQPLPDPYKPKGE